ncbi:hypothetical protein [Dyella agri]|uniref:Uncharacterized protein n=1 Tax=Dyella agri TaxID=1926869 RepID=A0ABW8KLU0_9GAMM
MLFRNLSRVTAQSRVVIMQSPSWTSEGSSDFPRHLCFRRSDGQKPIDQTFLKATLRAASIFFLKVLALECVFLQMTSMRLWRDERVDEETASNTQSAPG